MSEFTKFNAPLLIQYDSAASAALRGDYWRVAREFRYFIGAEGSQQWVTVPAGYLTDGASVPRALWSVIPPWGKYGQAAVVHDILCEYLAIVDHGVIRQITRREADDIFTEAMEVLGVPPGDIGAISQAVALYRLTVGASGPTTTPEKRTLEAEWQV